ncbi:hypothetical protein ASPWEDRAFT_50326 [Aspergillus wentii DTO 134E9]|uniref:Metallo-beta-lactamase domain-containing protein n=1 Tax=Aspergillus wentii DTO 134E9 TaxID=1073089 RepID=A0A1L9RPY7_ASPWE|nr:uncharacterized protein ASPWEDRAFT_50326 [Aspergillus wentii DTO 134E9]KAI9923939.1 Ethylmalonic encephalopathy 1 [Aspergillus wentii]OJJ36923.1 hypothetical protein ASPWEDRAFT_50326 [Aspergillus wentii DTO 134E9]
MQPIIHTVYEKTTGTWQYIVACPDTKDAVIIDPVLDFELSTFTVNTHSADGLLGLIAQQGYTITHILETHAHADHLTASFYLQQTLVASGKPQPQICIGQQILAVQELFGPKYDIPAGDLDNAFDHLFANDEVFNVGRISAKVLHLPGHTPDHVGYIIGENVFTGDSIFNPDVGSARCDFPGGDARTLYKSMKKLLSLPPSFKLYTGHDYPPFHEQVACREPMPYVTVEEQNERNKHAGSASTEEEFVRWRTERDRQLQEPRLIHQALQVNVRGGRMPRKIHGSRVFLNFLVDVPDMFVH